MVLHTSIDRSKSGLVPLEEWKKRFSGDDLEQQTKTDEQQTIHKILEERGKSSGLSFWKALLLGAALVTSFFMLPDSSSLGATSVTSQVQQERNDAVISTHSQPNISSFDSRSHDKGHEGPGEVETTANFATGSPLYPSEGATKTGLPVNPMPDTMQKKLADRVGEPPVIRSNTWREGRPCPEQKLLLMESMKCNKVVSSVGFGHLSLQEMYDLMMMFVTTEACPENSRFCMNRAIWEQCHYTDYRLYDWNNRRKVIEGFYEKIFGMKDNKFVPGFEQRARLSTEIVKGSLK